MSQVAVIATLEVKEGREADFEQLMRELVEKVNEREPGTLFYALFRAKEPRTYVMLERFESQEAFQAHVQGPLLREAGPGLGSVLARPMQLQLLERLV